MKNKEITMLELFKLIEDGKAPKRIKIYDEIYKLLDIKVDYINEIDNTLLSTNLTRTLKYNYLPTMLQINIEILPEENDDWEEIEEIDINLGILNMTGTEKYISNHVNKLIKNQKYLKEKMENRNV